MVETLNRLFREAIDAARSDDEPMKFAADASGPEHAPAGSEAGGQFVAKNAESPDAAKYPHLAHLLNGSKVHSEGHSKTEAKEKAMNLRRQGVYASVMQDPKGPRGKQHLVTVPKGELARYSAKASGGRPLVPNLVKMFNAAWRRS